MRFARPQENVPVASWLLPRRIRGEFLHFYRFARRGDDLADSPRLSLSERRAGLDSLAAEVDRSQPDQVYYESLLLAFRSDLALVRIASWAELLGYCQNSAAPVGRFLLHLHGINTNRVVAASDSLCCLLQILNHLQDLGKDWRELERLYLPASWVAEAGALLPDLAGSRLTEEWREVVDRALNGCTLLYARAEALPELLRAHGEPRLAAEAAMILKLALGLLRRLEHEDPLAGRIAPTSGQKATATLFGLWFMVRSFLPLQAPPGSNLALPIRLLPRRHRQAVGNLYRFCRLLDDCADGLEPRESKAARLAIWRVAVQGFCDSQAAALPDDSLPTEIKQLQPMIADYRLSWLDLEAIFAGMEFDLSPQSQLLTKAELDRYCDLVATAVGRLYLTILGLDPGLALNLGRSLQRVNILRDIVEDGARGRCYIPHENFPSGFCPPPPFTVDEILVSPALTRALKAFASDTASYFCSAARDLVTAQLSWRQRLSLELFARIYHRIFVKILRTHRRTPERLGLTRVRLSWLDWLRILLDKS